MSVSTPSDDSNPYNASQIDPEESPSQPSQVGWFFIPSFIGMLVGSPAIGPWLPFSFGDPGGRSLGAAAGGFAGLAIGTMLYRRNRRNRNGMDTPPEAGQQSEQAT
ncbi:MAG: hypothetical protein AB8G99_06225 [Planctomycetaceae bacterium]